MNDWIRDVNELIEEWYIPTSIERKRAVLMYFLMWILVWLNTKNMCKYEKYHLKQAMWRWVLFFILIPVVIVLLFLPYYFWLLSFFVLLWLVFFWIFFIKQAWNWEYLKWDKIMFPIFMWIWWWVLDLFEVDTDSENNELSNENESWKLN